MKRKNIAIIVTMILSASLMACGTNNPADTTTNENIKVAVQSATTLEENQTEKPVVTTTDTATESESIEADTEIATDVENTDVNNAAGITSEPEANVNNAAGITSEPEANVAESNESDYEVSYEPNVPAYVPDTTDTTPADIPDSTPAEEPDVPAPAPAEPAVHEHNWVPVKYYVEWITSTEPDSHVSWHDKHGNERTDKHTYSNAIGVDHYECECGKTKTGEDHDKLQDIINTKEISEDGLFYYRNDEEFSYPYTHTQGMYEYSAVKIK